MITIYVHSALNIANNVLTYIFSLPTFHILTNLPSIVNPSIVFNFLANCSTYLKLTYQRSMTFYSFLEFELVYNTDRRKQVVRTRIARNSCFYLAFQTLKCHLICASIFQIKISARFYQALRNSVFRSSLCSLLLSFCMRGKNFSRQHFEIFSYFS